VTTRGKNNINIWLPVIISILIGQLRNIFKSKRPRSSSVFGCSVNWSDWNVTIIFRFFQRCLKWQPKRCFNADGKYVLRLLNVVIHEHQFKRKGIYILQIPLCQGGVHEAKKTSGSLCFKLKVFIWRHVVYIPKSWTTFRGILICAIFWPRDMQEYYVILYLRKGYGFTIPVFFLYRVSRLPIHECLFILCIAYLSLCIFYKGVSWNSRFTSTDHVYLWRNRS
jgi:hypothetical protein